MSDRTGERRLVLTPYELVGWAALRQIRVGSLHVVLPDGRAHDFVGQGPGPNAAVTLRDRSVARRVISGGSIALAETYMDGAWDSPDLDAVLDFGIQNTRAGFSAKVPPVLRPFQRAWHSARDNSKRGSRENIEYHYDLGNDFYSLWLDDTMTYSSACFEADCNDLAEAQRRKWDRVLELLQPTSRDRILEIGCGWGGFAIHAVKQAGCRVTGITLSERQAAFARARIADEGLEGRIDIRLEDYRDVPGPFTAIASIEMFEAVGMRWWPTFFRRVKELLEPGRAAAMQVITIADDRFESYARNPDFIQRYIFPGGMLPSPSRFAESARGAGLEVCAPRFFGADYARTLGGWAERFEAVRPDVLALGFDERFVRMWRFYLSYCRAGFESGNVDVMQVRLEA